jgi:D-tagatose-1,6-bisphosphate aldolase subunit GatZ/KbaZ
MVRDHFAILKVGPAATFALREALMALCRSRPNCCRPARCSRLMQVLDDAMLAQPKHWPSTIRAAARNSACCAATA